MDDTGTNIERSGVNMSLIVTVGVISVLLLVVVLFTSSGYFEWMQMREVARKNVNYTPPALTALLDEQHDRLHQPAWVTPNEVAAVPIRKAMAEYAAQQGHAVPEGWEQHNKYQSLWNPRPGSGDVSHAPAATPSH